MTIPRTDPHSRAPGLVALARDAIMAAVHGARRVLESPARLDEMEAHMAGNEQQLRELAATFAEGLGNVKALVDSQNAKIAALQTGVDEQVAQALAADAAQDGEALAQFTEEMRSGFAQFASNSTPDQPAPSVPDAPAPTPNDNQTPAPSDTTDAGQNPPPAPEVPTVADDSGAAPA